ncbi:hypothetical protein J7E25_01395 [Agromyces sp. ISL-38]|uniref:hypothetical protein n=1 Tax=Agromyces sp. ISL-38 TaxID=2819107 RepID=UPI001BE8180E|nr:hypothetical protein [Agromyces sp. ISL-38]MBT2497742.1 hypothetical protein [Agromyces sp. ISL-38]
MSLGWFLSATLLCFLPQVAHPGRLALQNPLWLDQGVIGWMPLILLGCAILLYALGKQEWAAATLALGLPFAALAGGGSAGVRMAATAAITIAGAAIGVGLTLWAVRRQLRVAGGRR